MGAEFLKSQDLPICFLFILLDLHNPRLPEMCVSRLLEMTNGYQSGNVSVAVCFMEQDSKRIFLSCLLMQ